MVSSVYRWLYCRLQVHGVSVQLAVLQGTGWRGLAGGLVFMVGGVGLSVGAGALLGLRTWMQPSICLDLFGCF